MAILLGYVVDVAQGSIQKVTLELMVGRRSLPFGARVLFSGANLKAVSFSGVYVSVIWGIDCDHGENAILSRMGHGGSLRSYKV